MLSNTLNFFPGEILPSFKGGLRSERHEKLKEMGVHVRTQGRVTRTDTSSLLIFTFAIL